MRSSTARRRRRQKLLIWAAAVVVFFVLQWVVRTYFPIELAELGNRNQLARADVKSVEVGGLHAWVADRCGKTAAPCRCVALIHGLGDTAITWKRLLISGGLAGSKVYAPDLPGSGSSV